MFKKVIAFLVIFAMLVPFSSAVAADNAPAKPTVEEILNDYHRAALTAKRTGQIDTGSNYSRQSNTSGKTLEQETVDTLNAAGYEAYNVTTSNYSTLESVLNTDLASMGIDPNYSHIVVISGDNSGNTAQTRAYGDNLITPTPWPDDGGDGNTFAYTYGGVTYTMRYVTVTSVENPDYYASKTKEITPSYMSQFGVNFLTTSISLLVDYATAPVPTSAIFSLLGLDTSNGYTTGATTLTYHAYAKWTRVFIQVWTGGSNWQTVQSSAYVLTQSKCVGFVYNATTGDAVWCDGELISNTIYSPDYFNKAQCKEYAVLAYLNYYIDHDATGNIACTNQGTHMFTLYEEFSL